MKNENAHANKNIEPRVFKRVFYMCLFPKEQIKIAKKPIIVFKIIGKEEKYLFGIIKRWHSPMYESEVPRKYGKILSGCKNLDIKRNVHGDDFIDVGYHTYNSQLTAKESFVYIESRQIKPGLIPQGAEYCEGESGDIVSNQLILFEDDRKLEKYVLNNKIRL